MRISNLHKIADHAALALATLLLLSFFYGLCLIPFTNFKTAFQPPPELQSIAQRAVKALSGGTYAQLLELMPKDVWPKRELFERIVNSVPQRRVQESFYSYYGWRSFTSMLDDSHDSRHRLQIAQRYEGTPGYGVFALVLSEANGRYDLRSVHFAMNEVDESDLVAFPRDNRPWGAWLWLFAIPAIIIFQVFTLIDIFRNRILQKWLWYILAVVSAGRWTLNWSTGGVESAISIQLIGIGISKNGLFYPWLITLTIPLGAILYWILRKKLQQRYTARNTIGLTGSETGHENR